jgi:hypothetical protein
MITVTGIAALGGVIWQQDGVPVNITNTECYDPKLAPDGAGGAIVTWQDGRNGDTGADIYAQRMRSSGMEDWGSGGVGVCRADYEQENPQIIGDGAGGAIIAWEDYRSDDNWDVLAQRINADGAVLWATDGVTVSDAHNSQYDPQMTGDGAGGAIVTWRDDRYGNPDIFVQRMTSGGIAAWTPDGVTLCVDSGYIQGDPQITSDGNGGAIVTWFDWRNQSSGAANDIYAQRVYSNGTTAWTANGVAVCSATNMQDGQRIVSDGAGGAFIVWTDRRAGSDNTNIYVQRVHNNGKTAWSDDGEIVCDAAEGQQDVQIASDGAGGAIVVWEDERDGDSFPWDIYAQRILSDGHSAWASNGVSVCTAAGSQYSPQIVSDGRGGAVITWMGPSVSYDNTYAQRLDADGNAMWQANGLAVSLADGDQWDQDIVGDGLGGAIISWEDHRSLALVSGGYIYAQRVGTVGLYIPVVLKSY